MDVENEIEYKLLYYMGDGTLKNIMIPMCLCDKFKEEFESKKSLISLTTMEIQEFLMKNDK